MKRFGRVIMKCSSLIAALALSIGVSSAASACLGWFNQPEMPKGIEKFRKSR